MQEWYKMSETAVRPMRLLVVEVETSGREYVGKVGTK